MNVKRLNINNFRNIRELDMSPDEGINVIFGENAQGKTNLLESIWLFSGFRSFRGSKDHDLIMFGEDYLKSEIDFFGGRREQNAKLIINKSQKKIILNSVPLRASSELVGNFNCVVFSPSYLSLVKGSPSERRKFIDSALCQIKPSYAGVLTDYNKLLIQRNSFLKNLKHHGENYDFLEIWNQKLIEKSVIIVNDRIKYLKELSREAYEIYGGLSGKKEELSLHYDLRISQSKYRTADDKISYEEIERLFKQSEESDMLYGTTNIGAHRDEIEISINGISAKNFGSQGQQRSSALALKLGEAEILKNMTGERPVALLDDVMSELDVNRQDYILNHIKDWQVFITCCDPSTVLRLYNGKTFEIRKGQII